MAGREGRWNAALGGEVSILPIGSLEQAVIQWRETETGYLATVSRLRAAALWGMIGSATALAGFGLGPRDSWGYHSNGFFPGPSALGWLGPVLALLCLVKALSGLRNRGSVEAALEGGKARWGAVADVLSERFAHVVGFRAVEVLGPWAHHVVVVLPDGRCIPVLRGYWSTPSAVARVVARLNELVGVSQPPR